MEENVVETKVDTNVQKELTEDDLVKAYLGKDAEKLMSSNINWGAAILGQAIGPVWLFFRKAHLVGFLYLIVTIIVSKIANKLNIDEAYYIMSLIYLVTATPALLWDVRRKASKIMSNVGLTDEEKLQLAAKKGKPSWLAVVIYSICLVIYILFVLAGAFLAAYAGVL